MLRVPLLAGALLAATLALPAPAAAQEASIWAVDLPARGDRSLAASPHARVFHLAAVHWQGPGRVELRTRSLGGRWSPWRPAAPEGEDLPDPGSAEGRRRPGWRLGNPWWSGPSDRIEVRTAGRVTRVRTWLVRSPAARVPLRMPAAAGAPVIVPRSAWGADESIVRAEPQYAPQVRYAVVHHTAGQNVYAPAEAPAIVRAIQLYHVRGNGWNDIGYNALVDKYGVVYEGRRGGVDRPVVGAHAQGFNTGSVGVALLGTYTGAQPPAAAEQAIASYVAWRLDLAHVDPLATFDVVSGGSPKFPEGIPVFLRAVSGHRDVGLTTCPGDALYARLPGLATVAQALGGTKVWEPRVAGAIGSLVRFQARVSDASPWRVSVRDALGVVLAEGTGFGPTLDWSWDATTAPLTGVRWRIEAGLALPAEGTIGQGVTTALRFTGAAADPETISPNGDGQIDATTITYTITTDANVSAVVLDAAGLQVAELERPRWRRAGEHVVTFDGLAVADGLYTVRLLAKAAGGQEATADVTVGVSRTLGAALAAPIVLTPNGDGRGDSLRVRFTLAAPATVRVRVLREGVWVATPFTGLLQAGRRLVAWDGRKRAGRPLDGAYEAVIEAQDAIGTTRIAIPFKSDATVPVVRVVSAREPVRLWVSEAAILTVRVNGAARRVEAPGRGEVRLAGVRRVSTLTVVARDAAGNRGVLRRG